MDSPRELAAWLRGRIGQEADGLAIVAAGEARAIAAELERGADAIEALRDIVESEDGPCEYDHHGQCQAHGWFGEPGECRIRDARTIVGLAASAVEGSNQ